MRICVFGAGAVGGNFAARLSAKGHDVSVVARGPHLAAIRSKGLTLKSPGQATIHATARASDKPIDLGPQDVIIVTLKAHDIPAFAAVALPLLTEDTAVVFAHNGIPWWYGDGLPQGARVPPDLQEMLDPAGLTRRTIGLKRTLGGVIYSSNDQPEPGLIINNSTNRNRLLIGEIDDGQTSRIQMLRDTLSEAEIDSPPVAALRQKIWDKLIANLSVSILSFLTERTSREVFDDPYLRSVSDDLAGEGAMIAKAFGYLCHADPAGPAAGHKSSMLQDFERGRHAEIDALLLAPQALARSAGVRVPVLDTIISLVRHKFSRPHKAATPGR